MKKRISIYICVMMLAFSFAGIHTSEQSEKKPEIDAANQIHWRICGIRMLLSQCRKIRYYEKGVVVEYGQAALDRVSGIVKAGVDIDKIDMKVDGNTLTISFQRRRS